MRCLPIKELITERNRMRRQFQRKGTEELRKEKNQLTMDIENKINTWKKEKWDKKLEKLDCKDSGK